MTATHEAGLFAVEFLLAALAGGALGAAIGALPSFSLAGIVIVVGEAGALVAGGSNGDTGATALTDLIGFGPAFGPHVAFAGGVAATAYAARKGYLQTDFEYHEAKHVSLALGTRPDVLAVGAVFGVAGYLLAGLSAGLSFPVDPVFASVLVSGFGHRFVLGYPLVGRVDANALDMTPFESGDRQTESDADAGRLRIEPWLPHQYRWGNVAAVGVAAGVFGAFVAIETGSHLLAFGIAAASLLFPSLGMKWTPAVYHVVLPASIAALATPAEPAVALLVGAAFGLGSGLAGEVAQRLLYAHADTHLDPGAAGIVVSTLVIGLLEIAGVWTTAVIPAPA
jgi:hypothetical protein